MGCIYVKISLLFYLLCIKEFSLCKWRLWNLAEHWNHVKSVKNAWCSY